MSRPASQHFLALLSHFSLRTQYRLADLISFILRNTPNQISRQTRQNIHLYFAELDRSEQQRLYRDSIRHTCYAMTELAAVWCWPVERVLERITMTDICPEFEHCSGSRIIIAPHLGSWETLAIWLGHHCNAIMLYKRRRNAAADHFIKTARARSGGILVPTSVRGLRKLFIGLKQGASLMILPDQRPGKKKAQVASQFFGADAPTTTLVQNLCRKIDCDVFIASMCRSNPPGEFSLRIRPLEHRRLAAGEASSAQYMNDQIEALVRQQPSQYQWAYRRFRAGSNAALN